MEPRMELGIYDLTRELIRELLEEKNYDVSRVLQNETDTTYGFSRRFCHVPRGFFAESRVGCCCSHMNPHLYVANYYGHKVHLDQNEKLSMFGVTHIMAIDGYSGKIVSLVTMPIKNCSLIYEHVYMKLVEEFGLWDQIRVDYGTEWALILHVQNLLSEHRNDPTLAPYVQTSSRQNHIVERLWVEVNNRVNYPIKRSLIDMIENNELDLSNSLHQFCVSWCTIRVANVGLKLLVQSWNNHPLPRRFNSMGRGFPNHRMTIDNRVKRIPINLLPTPAEAIQLYSDAGGRITGGHSFGVDPLSGNLQLQQLRQDSFTHDYSFESMFHQLINDNDSLFKEGIYSFADITYRLAQSLI